MARPLIGIDDIAMHVPHLFVDMRDFATLREQNYDKLRKGLGLEAMAIPDAHEDTATMGANAVARLIDRNGLDPRQIGRLYLGTESALDGAKPTATYILEMLEMRYGPRYGAGCFRHCDVVDMTFACIGAVDALHNTLDWVARGGPDTDRIGIVVFADNAKYDLGSTGEYTQGAGGGAMLVRHHPRLLAIEDRFGVSTRPVHDFFKPRRSVAVKDLLAAALELARESGGTVSDDLVDAMMARLASSDRFREVFGESPTVQVHKDTPVFDGQFSNSCYREAVKEAFLDFRSQAVRDGRYDPDQDEVLTEQWARILLHLPYAFQGKRMFPDVFRHERQALPMWADIEAEIGPAPDKPASPEAALEAERAQEDYRRRVSRTEAYRTFVTEKIERGQRASSLIGNQYTGSLFLALMSTFESDLLDDTDLTGKRVGLCGYGSGAKAKVFEGIVQPGWREIAARFDLFVRLRSRQPIPTDLYEALHRGRHTDSVRAPQSEFVLAGIDRGGVREGARRYAWVD